MPVQPRRHHSYRRGRVRRGAHGKNIAQRMVGGDLAEAVRVVDQCAKKIYGLNLGFAGRNAHQRGVVGRRQTDEHVRAVQRLQTAQGPTQHTGTHFGRTAAATHGLGGLRLRALLRIQVCKMRQRASVRRHGRHGGNTQVGKTLHKAPVDAVLPAPHPGTRKTERAARGHGIAVAGANQCQPVFLGPVRL